MPATAVRSVSDHAARLEQRLASRSSRGGVRISSPRRASRGLPRGGARVEPAVGVQWGRKRAARLLCRSQTPQAADQEGEGDASGDVRPFGPIPAGDMPTNDPVWNPDIDDVQLDDEYYQLVGRSGPEAAAEGADADLDVDPESQVLSIDDIEGMLQDPSFRGLFSGDLAGPYDPGQQDDEATYANMPQVVLLAGLRAEELPVVRVLMDKLGWPTVRAVPVTASMLHRPVAEALQEPEPEWDKPRSGEWLGGGWGAERIILFSGLPTGAQAQLVEIMEQSGLPPVSIARVMRPDDEAAFAVLGEFLAKAVQEQRAARRAAARPLWEDAPERIGKLGDLDETLRRARAEQEAAAAKHAAGGADSRDGKQDEGANVSGDDATSTESSAAAGLNIIDELAGGLVQGEPGLDAANPVLKYTDLHYGSKPNPTVPHVAEKKPENGAVEEAPPAIDPKTITGVEDLRQLVARAKASGMSADAVREMLTSAAKLRGSKEQAAPKDKGHEILPVPKEVESLLGYEGSKQAINTPKSGKTARPELTSPQQPRTPTAPTAASPPPSQDAASSLKVAIQRAVKAGMPPEEIKELMSKLAASKSGSEN